MKLQPSQILRISAVMVTVIGILFLVMGMKLVGVMLIAVSIIDLGISFFIPNR